MTALADRKVEAGAAPAYALGYSDAEFRRLEQQGAIFRDLTEDVMRVWLDPRLRGDDGFGARTDRA